MNPAALTDPGLINYLRQLASQLCPPNAQTLAKARPVSDPCDWQIEAGEESLLFDGAAYNAWVAQQVGVPGCLLPGGKQFVYKLFRANTDLLLASTDGALGFTTAHGPHGLAVWDCQGNYANAYFSEDVLIPVLEDAEETWMSLTPMELTTCLPGVQAAHGHVLIGGMGLGWMAQMIAAKPDVASVTVVEIDPAVAELFGAALWQRHFDKVMGVYVDDLWRFLEQARGEELPAGVNALDYDSFIFDIWPDWGSAATDEDYQEFAAWAKAESKTLWAWGDVDNSVIARHIQSRPTLRWVEHPGVELEMRR